MKCHWTEYVIIIIGAECLSRGSSCQWALIRQAVITPDILGWGRLWGILLGVKGSQWMMTGLNISLGMAYWARDWALVRTGGMSL